MQSSLLMILASSGKVDPMDLNLTQHNFRLVFVSEKVLPVESVVPVRNHVWVGCPAWQVNGWYLELSITVLEEPCIYKLDGRDIRRSLRHVDLQLFGFFFILKSVLILFATKRKEESRFFHSFAVWTHNPSCRCFVEYDEGTAYELFRCQHTDHVLRVWIPEKNSWLA